MKYDNSGILFKNLNKITDKHPDYRGTVNIAGTECFIVGWINTGTKGKLIGKKYISLKITPKDEAQQRVYTDNEETENKPEDSSIKQYDFDDEIDF